jgi:hypothetical protein
LSFAYFSHLTPLDSYRDPARQRASISIASLPERVRLSHAGAHGFAAMNAACQPWQRQHVAPRLGQRESPDRDQRNCLRLIRAVPFPFITGMQISTPIDSEPM